MIKNILTKALVVFTTLAYSQQSSSVSSFTANFNHLASSIEIFNMKDSYSKILSYDPYSESVCFIQCKSPSYQASPANESNAGTIVAYLGKNNGTNWDSTVLWSSQNSVHKARYPQGGIFNPLNQSNIDNCYIVSTGRVLGGIPISNIGNFYASKSASLTPKNTAGADEQYMSKTLNYGSSTSPNMTKHDATSYAFSVTDDGKVRSVGSLYSDISATALSGQGFRGSFLASGNFNSGVFVWTPDSFIPSCVVRTDGAKQLHQGCRMAFNSIGSTGYMVMIGALQSATLSNRGWQPIVYKTTNSGITWTLMNGIDFNTTGWEYLLKSISPVNSNTNLTIPYFNVNEGFDITVDKDNNLHIFTTVIGTSSTHQDSLTSTASYTIDGDYGYNWPYKNTKWPYLIDFIGDGSNPWSYKIIDSVGSQGEWPGHSLVNNPIWCDNSMPVAGLCIKATDMRLQLSRDLNGEHILYSWAESDTLFPANNSKWNRIPNIKTRAMRVLDKSISAEEYTVTNPPVGANGLVKDNAYFYYMSSLSKGYCTSNSRATFTVPYSVTNNIFKNPNSIAETFYANGLLEFNFPINNSVNCATHLNEFITHQIQLNVYPNPASENTHVQISLEEKTNVTLEIHNTIGQLVYSDRMKCVAGENKININVGQFASGVYLIKLKTEKAEAVKKLIVE